MKPISRNTKRLIDLTVSGVLLIALSPLGLAIGLWVRLSSRGPAVYWSQRVGRRGHLFWMPKFRTMRLDAPQVATHLLGDRDRWVTRPGRFLRKTSLDELPQLWSILRGQMSFVGPRPALHNQHDLNAMRDAAGVHELTPGLTGWAQVNGRDDLANEQKVARDAEYLSRRGLAFDAQIVWMTFGKCLRGEGVVEKSLPNRQAA